ncbi:MAG TPA: phosphotransferase [Pyrinomonadaceae bacterium]|jgi:hypothetical protein|nr:phosphotransferase [Pyrinomonadaceae bacterium]
MPSSQALAPHQLTQLLYDCDALSCGSVTEVRLDKQVDTIVSTLTFLVVTYSPDASPALPERLLFKQPLRNENELAEIFCHELDFYSRLAPEISSPPILPWYLTTAKGDLILQDLRASHTSPTWPLLPSPSESVQTVEALAEVHTRWWEDSSLGVKVGSNHTADSLSSMVSGVTALLPGFCDAAGDDLSNAQRKLLDRVFGSRLRPWLRLTDSRALTVIHGDAHTWNFLLAREEGAPVYLIDWQLWHVDVGARDLAFLIAAHWDADSRQAMEIPLLHRYHEALLARGLANYTFDDLWLDYRYCVVRNLTMPLFFWNRGLANELWRHTLKCALAAYEDLDCDELL